MLKYLDFSLVDDVPIMDQVHGLQILVSRLCDLQVVIPKTLQVGTIISKLPLTWNDYRKKLLNLGENLTVEKLLRYLRIEKETRKHDVVYLSQNSKVNHVGEKKVNKGKRKKSSVDDKQDKKRQRSCYYCHKKGHYIKNCRRAITQKKHQVPRQI